MFFLWSGSGWSGCCWGSSDCDDSSCLEDGLHEVVLSLELVAPLMGMAKGFSGSWSALVFDIVGAGSILWSWWSLFSGSEGGGVVGEAIVALGYML